MQNVVGGRVGVVDHEGREVPADAETVGEVRLRGNTVMLGYFRDDAATREATADGWFWTGDLGVRHTDGYVELRDRSKDVIVSGGENISSIEVEQALAGHPSVMDRAVVGAPDDPWGEVPVAHVTLRPGATVEERELIEYVKGRIARYKAPARVIFGDLPHTSTGKI